MNNTAFSDGGGAAGPIPYDRIVALAADAIICVDAGQRIILFNDGARLTFGYEPHEVLGQQLEILLPERFRGRHRGHVDGFAAGPPSARHMGQRSSIFARRKNGEEFQAEASISKTQMNGGYALTVVLRDVSQRLRMEQARKTEAERLRMALQASGLGAIELIGGAMQVRLLGHASAFWGFEEQQALSASDVLARVHREDLGNLLNKIRTERGDHSSFESSFRVVRPDGSIKWLHLVISSYESEEGDVRFGILEDVTDFKEAAAELERQVNERTSELQDEIKRREVLNAQLLRAQRMEAYGQLTGGVAHDFNNLLTIIGGNLELLGDGLSDARSQRLHQRATEAVAMGARLTERLLTFARRRQLEPRVLNINEQITHLLDLLRRTLGEAIRISSTLAADLGQVMADQSEVENAILNLAINARDAMPKGGRLMLETANVTIDDSFMAYRQDEPLKHGQYVMISVSDNGTGMTPEVLKAAFEPFFTTKEHGRGTGLGLSTVYGFARQSNGTVIIYSEFGRGTTVCIYLPRIDEPSGGTGAASVQLTPKGESQLVLVVEDNPDVREVTVTRLRKLGYSVIESASGPDALGVMERRSDIALVFSDIMMAGGMSGYDLAKWIAANKPGLKCLLTTGFAEALAGADSGAPKVLRKPYSLEQLAKAVAAALSGRAQAEDTAGAKL